MEAHEITPEYLRQRERATRAARWRFDCFEGEAIARCERTAAGCVARADGPGPGGCVVGPAQTTPERAMASLVEALAVPASVSDPEGDA